LVSGLSMSQQDDDQLQAALERFESIMDIRAEMHRRLGCRVRNVVRGGMLMLVLIGVALSILLWMLSTRMHQTEQALGLMQAHVQSVQNDMSGIRQVVALMRQQVGLMQPISAHLGAIGASTYSMSEEMQVLQAGMAEIDERMSHVEVSLGNISTSVGSVGHSVNGMNYNVHSLSRPTSMFNWMPLP